MDGHNGGKPIGTGAGVKREEQGGPAPTCERARGTWSTVWDKIRHLPT
jgi:hypothetical protein